MRKWSVAVLIAASTFACKKSNPPHETRTTAGVVYLENNDFHDNANAVMAYRQQSDGTLSPVPGSPFFTNGAGIANPKQALGPDDSDHQLAISSDGNFLLAINPGSNTIAVFRIGSEGKLTGVAGSPFASGGKSPVSIDMKGNMVFVTNQAGDPLHPTREKPNYVTMTMDANGALTLVPNSKFELDSAASPSQVLVSNNGKFVFGADFLSFMLMPAPGSLRSFSIWGGGILQNNPGSPYTLPVKGGALGIWQHPASDILYVGFPVTSQVGIYGINETTGALTYRSALDAGVAACWLRTSKDGKYLYALNSGENTISIYNSSDAAHPFSLGKFALKLSGPSYTNPMGMSFTTSEDFALAFSQDEKYLYVISQYTNADFSVGKFNILHTLVVGSDGKLDEPIDPVILPVDNTYRPQGLVTTTSTFTDFPGDYHK